MNYITIITPMYNTEKYLFKCLDSIYANDMSGVEHILINDGSPNFTDDIKSRIKEKYKHTILIDKKENEGIGFAYRDAFEVASGEYIMFLDSDDQFADSTLSTIKSIVINEPYDIIQFSGKSIDEQGNIVNRQVHEALIIDNQRDLWDFHYNQYKFPGLSLRAFRRELFKDVKLLKQNIGIDELLTPQLLYRANSLRVIEDELYIILVHSDSVSRQITSTTFLKNAYNVYNMCLDIYLEKNTEYARYWEEKYCLFTMNFYNHALLGKNTDARRDDILSFSNFDDYYVKTNGFDGCFKDNFYRRMMCYLLGNNKLIYDLIARFIYKRRIK